MNAALLRSRGLPPPTPIALRLPRQSRASAGLATNALKPASIKLVVRNFVRANIIPNFIRRPSRERIHLHQERSRITERLINLDHRQRRPRDRRVAPLSGDP